MSPHPSDSNDPEPTPRRTARPGGEDGSSSGDADSPARADTRKPRAFFLVSTLLAVLIGVALLSDPNALHSRTETREHVIKRYLNEGALDTETFEFLRDTRVFRARVKLDENKKPIEKDGQAIVDKGVRAVELRFSTDETMDTFKREFIDPLENVSARVRESPAAMWEMLLQVVFWVALIFLFYFLFFRPLRGPGGPGGGILSFSKSRAKLVQEKSDVTFEDVAGIDEAKSQVFEIVEFLRNPEKFQRLGGRIPKGVMLIGAPGTGKTLLARAIAGEAGVPFFSICGSDFVEMFVGVGAARVRDLFKQARERAPCIVFLDEVDAVGRRRGSGLGGGHDEREQTLNAILVEMDGFESDSGIILVAATNRPDVLDPALLRPGRFDREITMDLPDVDERRKILEVHVAKVKMAPDVDLGRIARGTPTFSGAELAALVNEAAILAAMRDQEAILESDLEEARDRIRYGVQKKSRVMVDEDRRITAYHEAGHAIVAHLLPEVEPLHKVTIIPRGPALGLTMQLPERDRYHLSRKQVLGNLKLLYGGRIAEELFCGDVTSGASSDIQRATDLARRMVCEWGMSDALGPIRYTENEETLFLGREVTRSRDHSDEVALRIDEEVRRVVDDCYEATRELIVSNRDAIDRIARALLERETLTGDDVARLVRGEELDDPSDPADGARGDSSAVSAAAGSGSIATADAEVSPDGSAKRSPGPGGMDSGDASRLR